MLSHVRAIHQGIKVGGNPALLTPERVTAMLSDVATRLKKGGYKEVSVMDTAADFVACPRCRAEAIAQLRKLGYTVQEPASKSQTVKVRVGQRILTLKTTDKYPDGRVETGIEHIPEAKRVR